MDDRPQQVIERPVHVPGCTIVNFILDEMAAGIRTMFGIGGIVIIGLLLLFFSPISPAMLKTSEDT
jgi:hypothetical protein